MRFLLFTIAVLSTHSTLAVAQSYDVGSGFTISRDQTETVVVTNNFPHPQSWLKDTIRLSKRGAARTLVQQGEEFYLLDHRGTLWRLDQSRVRLRLLNLAKAAGIAATFGFSLDAGLLAGGYDSSIWTILPWLISATAVASAVPPSLLAHSEVFNGANFFTDWLQSGVRGVLRVAPGNYEVELSDGSTRPLSSYSRGMRSATLSCEAWLSRFW